MKSFTLIAALALAAALAATPSEAAKKRKSRATPPAAAATSDPYVVRDYDGEILGRDPDPFIRLMIRRAGKIQDQSGR